MGDEFSSVEYSTRTTFDFYVRVFFLYFGHDAIRFMHGPTNVSTRTHVLTHSDSQIHTHTLFVAMLACYIDATSILRKWKQTKWK